MSEEKRKITAEEMEKVAGGYITQRGDEPYTVYHDDEGTVPEFFLTREELKFHAIGKGTCPYCGKVLG